VAEEFVRTRDMRGFGTLFVSAKERVGRPGEWAVVFDLRDKQGHVVDGPMIVLVDERTGSASFLEGQ